MNVDESILYYYGDSVASAAYQAGELLLEQENQLRARAMQEL